MKRLKLALKFVFATDLSDFRLELTFTLDLKSRFFTNKISSGHLRLAIDINMGIANIFRFARAQLFETLEISD